MGSILMIILGLGFSALLIRSYMKKKRKNDRNLAIVMLIITAILIISNIMALIG